MKSTMKKFLTAIGMLILVTGCNKQSENSAVSGNNPATDSLSQNSESPSDIKGVYKGEISCDDCESAELTLKENNTYSLILHLSDEIKTANSIVTASGKYTWNGNDSVISLDQYNLHFKVREGKLYYMDPHSHIDENEVLVKER